MPELPEVETVRRQLAAAIPGLTFVEVERVEPSMLLDVSAKVLGEALRGRRIEEIGRLGKFLIVRLSEGAFLTLHLGMTGQLLVDAPGPSRHSRFVFHLSADDGVARRLEFRDTRKFGRVHYTVGAPPARLETLGPDAWLGDWDAAYLGGRLAGRTAPLKAILLDQRHLAGIGNIYADEILWWSRLSPLRRGGSLNDDEVGRLAAQIKERLGEGVRFLGCSISGFVDTAGEPGHFQDWLRAYGKQGQWCARCGGSIVRVVVAGRGTAFCPQCQV